ncbi:tyrosine-type recombinase/integrase [Mycobacteroides chelonae]|nr:tyrosine-type recombinase/integrase [Mycobacteroides chelonae]
MRCRDAPRRGRSGPHQRPHRILRRLPTHRPWQGQQEACHPHHRRDRRHDPTRRGRTHPGSSPTGWLFPGNDNGHLSPRWVGTLCAKVMPEVWTMHKLRHRFATRAYRATRNIRAVQRLLGHASVATTQIYTAVDDHEMRAAVVGASGSGVQTPGKPPHDPHNRRSAR